MTQPMLFTPIKLRDLTLKNRIVVSPMCQYSAENGFLTDWHFVHLGKFAQGGAGAVFVEASAVEPHGRITYGDAGIWSDAHVVPLKRIANFVKSQGAAPAMQLAATAPAVCGFRSKSLKPSAPSGRKTNLYSCASPRSMASTAGGISTIPSPMRAS